MTMLIYAAVSISFLALILWLANRSHRPDLNKARSGAKYRQRIGSARWLDLSDRIFDPSDARWVEDELAFPQLAKTLQWKRRRLAILWLQSLKASFDELVRTPAAASMDSPETNPIGSWQILWLTIRFEFLIHYALLVVKLFGPYHKLIPSITWSPVWFRKPASLEHAVLAETRNSRW